MSQYNHYEMRPADEINQAISELPTAQVLNIHAPFRREDGTSILKQVEEYNIVRSTATDGTHKHVFCPTDKYRLIQHKDAFRPIIDGLTQAGLMYYKFVMDADHRRARLQLFVGDDPTPEMDTVNLGIQVTNSFDGSSRLVYGFDMNQRQKYIEIVGYRQVCSNGMKIRVPLEEAEFVRAEMVEKLKSLYKKSISFQHSGDMATKIKGMEYMAEALTILQPGVEAMIRKAQAWTIDNNDQLKRLVDKYVGKRYQGRVELRLASEDQTLWGLYNAMTAVASHDQDINPASRDTLKEKAAGMLMAEVTA